MDLRQARLVNSSQCKSQSEAFVQLPLTMHKFRESLEFRRKTANTLPSYTQCGWVDVQDCAHFSRNTASLFSTWKHASWS